MHPAQQIVGHIASGKSIESGDYSENTLAMLFKPDLKNFSGSQSPISAIRQGASVKQSTPSNGSASVKRTNSNEMSFSSFSMVECRNEDRISSRNSLQVEWTAQEVRFISANKTQIV